MAFKYNPYKKSDEVKKKEKLAKEHSTYKQSSAVTNAKNALDTHNENKVGDYQKSADVLAAEKLAKDYSVYNPSTAVTNAKKALDAHNENKVDPWTGGTYGKALEDAVRLIAERPGFSYDVNADMLYQQYKDQYINLGNLAMQDTMGQAAALTGGYGNSYAATAGNQAYQSYLRQLNDVVPELYQLALNQYNQESQNLRDNVSMYGTLQDREYGVYRDNVADWNSTLQHLTDTYNNERNFDYGKFSDNRDYYASEADKALNFDYGMHRDKVADWNTTWQQLSDTYNNERNFDYGKFSDDRDYYASEADKALNFDYGKYSDTRNLKYDDYQLAQNLALQREQLAETIRHNKETEKKTNSGGSGGGGGGGSGKKVGGGSGNQNQTTQVDPNSSKIKTFKSCLQTVDEFSRRGGTYKEYQNYVAEQINAWLDAGDLTEEEAQYLRTLY